MCFGQLAQFLQEVYKAGKVIFVIQKRFLHALTYRFRGSKVNHPLHIAMTLEEILYIGFITQVEFLEYGHFTCNFSNVVFYIFLGIGKVINDNHIKACIL